MNIVLKLSTFVAGRLTGQFADKQHAVSQVADWSAPDKCGFADLRIVQRVK